MRRYKPLPALFVVAVLAMAACSGSNEPAATTGPPTATTTPVTSSTVSTSSTVPATATTRESTTTVATTTTTALPPQRLEVAMSETDRAIILDSGEVRMAVDKVWGTAIREMWLGERNLVNNYDGGRLIGVSVYDSAHRGGDHPNDTGWNATPSDWHDHANRPLETSFDGRTLYTRVRNLQWFPEGHGGGPGEPVPTDLIVESWFEFLEDPHLVRVRYRLTHEGDHRHRVAPQEFPFAYGRTPFDRYVSYTGGSPWTGDDVSFVDELPVYPERRALPASEHWGGLVDDSGTGLLMWAPQAYPSFSYVAFDNPGPPENAATYLLPKTHGPIDAGMVWETEVFLYAGHHEDARDLIYALRERMDFEDEMYPYGFVDDPPSGANVSGTVEISGWAIDDRGVEEVEVLVDGDVVGVAAYGSARADVASQHPGLPGEPAFGYRYRLEASGLAAGEHEIEVIARDAAGNSTSLLPGAVTVTVESD